MNKIVINSSTCRWTHQFALMFRWAEIVENYFIHVTTTSVLARNCVLLNDQAILIKCKPV